MFYLHLLISQQIWWRCVKVRCCWGPRRSNDFVTSLKEVLGKSVGLLVSDGSLPHKGDIRTLQRSR